ncbi:hypothetical protein ACQ4LE_005108 [Meloidogyne hapla]|uniref:C-type lectin domain-containing protein n=1 Tax=Meloidogyne hapla TaxID=6305 RepID=A0A1I8BC11_MELHA
MKTSLSKIDLLTFGVLIGCIFSNVSGNCQAGWSTMDDINGFKAIISESSNVNLFTARLLCTSINASIASITSSVENDFIKTLTNTTENPVWVGVFLVNSVGSSKCKLANGNECSFGAPNTNDASASPWSQNNVPVLSDGVYGVQMKSNEWVVTECSDRLPGIICETVCEQ